MAEFSKTKIINKGLGTFKCSTCDTVGTQLARGFGKLPNCFRQESSNPQTVQFFKDMAGKTQKDVLAAAEAFVKMYEVQEEYFDNGGAFQPLDYWAKQGYDADAIKTKTKDSDKMWHDVLGECYRVRMVTSGTSGKRGSMEESGTRGRAKRQKFNPCGGSSAKPEEEPETPKQEEEQSDESEDGGSSSSSSSSSDSDEKGKKAKKTKKLKKKAKKAKKAQKAKAKKEKSQKARKAKDDKELKAREREACKITSKLYAPLTSLDGALRNPLSSGLSAWLRDKALHLKQEVEALNLEAQRAAGSLKGTMPDAKDPGVKTMSTTPPPPPSLS